MQTDPRIDAYIQKAAPFAKPILDHLRAVVHEACPDVEEKIKWGMPYFIYKGDILCGMAAFKGHCVLVFWKAALMKDPMLMENARAETAMGHFGKITSLKDLPTDKKLTSYIKEAMELNDKCIKLPRLRTAVKKELAAPQELMTAISKSKKAWDVFDNLSYSHRKEYIQWICEAKTETTRNKRIAKTVELLSEGKNLNSQ